MQIVLLIVVAGVWAMFLIPSFLSSRREAPIVSTQAFARDAERLNVVRAMATSPDLARRRAILIRRRNAIALLAVLAVATLAAAIVTGSVALLAVNLMVDVLLAVYVGLLAQVKQRAGLAPPIRLHVADRVDDTADQATVRVLAG